MAEETAPPAQAASMRRVTKEEFYTATGGPLNIHPRIVPGKFDDISGYVCEWRTQDYAAKLIGVSDSGTTFQDSRYWLK